MYAANWLAVILSAGLMRRHPLVQDLTYRFLACIIIVAGFRFMLRVFDGVEGSLWPAMGFPKAQARRDLLWGIVIGGGMILVAFLAIIAFDGLSSIKINITDSSIRKGLEVFLLLLFGALLEELMFRGYPFQRLVESIGAVGAILVLSALFGAVHLDNPNSGGVLSWGFFNTIAVGVLFSVAYLRSRSLWLPIGMHFGWNFFLGVVFGLPVSGLRDFNVLSYSVTRGSKLLTGGAYGLEASLTGAIVIVLGFVPVLAGWRPRRPDSAPELPAGSI